MLSRIIICTGLIFLIVGTGNGRTANRAAKIVEYSGSLSISRSARQIKPRVGFFILPGDTIKTAGESSASLELRTGTLLQISENAVFSIDTCEYGSDQSCDIRIFVGMGELISNVKKFSFGKSVFEIRTPTAVAAIRGTIFQTRVAKGGVTYFGVLKGLIDVGWRYGKGGSFSVASNHKTTVSRNSLNLVVEQIPKAEKLLLFEKALSIMTIDEQEEMAKEFSKEKDTEKEDPAKEEETEGSENNGKEDGDVKNEENLNKDENADNTETEAAGGDAQSEPQNLNDPANQSDVNDELSAPDNQVMDNFMEDIMPNPDEAPLRNEVPPEEIIDANPSASYPGP